MLAAAQPGPSQHLEHRYVSLFMALTALTESQPGYEYRARPKAEHEAMVAVVTAAMDSYPGGVEPGTRQFVINQLLRSNDKSLKRTITEGLNLVGVVPAQAVEPIADRLTTIRSRLSHVGIIKNVEDDAAVLEVIHLADLIEWLIRSAMLIRMGASQDAMSQRLRANARFRATWNSLPDAIAGGLRMVP